MWAMFFRAASVSDRTLLFRTRSPVAYARGSERIRQTRVIPFKHGKALAVTPMSSHPVLRLKCIQ